MREAISDSVRLQHIMECITEIGNAVNGYAFESFSEDHIRRIAVVKWLEIIGEAASHISKETKLKNKEIEWEKMIGLRHIVVHEYFGINYEVIWEAATIHIPRLKSKIEVIILDLNGNFLTN